MKNKKKVTSNPHHDQNTKQHYLQIIYSNIINYLGCNLILLIIASGVIK